LVSNWAQMRGGYSKKTHAVSKGKALKGKGRKRRCGSVEDKRPLFSNGIYTVSERRERRKRARPAEEGERRGGYAKRTAR